MDLRTTVIGLTGASGGLGTSTLAAAVAGLCGRLGRRALLVDLRPNGGGLDQLTGCAHEPGQRWPAREEGMPALQTRDLLVRHGVTVLSQRGAVLPPPVLGAAAVRSVARLAGEHEVTVLDLPPADHPQAPAWFTLCGTVVLVAGTTPPQVVAALVAQACAPGTTGLVLRPGQAGLDPGDVASLLGLPLVHQLLHDPSVPRAVLEQEWPGAADGAARDTAAAVLGAALDTAGRAA